jgi:hypothetical protein
VPGRRVIGLVVFGLALGVLAAPTAGAERTTAGHGADRALARTSLLQLNDLPPGWVQGSTSGGLPISKVGAPCRRQAAIENSATAHLPGPTFAPGSDESGSSSAAVFSNAARAAAFASSLEGIAGQNCVGAQAQGAAGLASLQSGVSASLQTIGRLSVAPLGADQEFAYRVVLQVSKNGLTAKIYADETFVRVGRVAISFTHITSLTPPSDDLGGAFQRVVQRSQQAQMPST